ncbi:MAG: hypothetical protein ACE1Y4_07710, partial [Lysobacterales bacterium]
MSGEIDTASADSGTSAQVKFMPSIAICPSSVYGLLLIYKQADLADMARLHTYIRPLKLAYVDAVRGGGVHPLAFG